MEDDWPSNRPESGDVRSEVITNSTSTTSSFAAATSATPTTETSGASNSSDSSIFKTQKPNGAFRDEIVVEVNLIDGEEYRGTVTTREAINTIFVNILGFSKEALGSITIGYSRGRIITYKLINQFDIDQLKSIENFEFKRESRTRGGETKTSTLTCRIRGIRKSRINDQATDSSYVDEGFRWVKIEGCEYRVEKREILNWLEKLGKVESDITEDKIKYDSDDSEDSNGHTIGNGIYSVKMKLTTDLPQFVPMYGKRIRLYHRGITKKCTNCFGPHARKVCSFPKVQWVEYVSDFMLKYPDIPEEFYGKWPTVVAEWRKAKATPNLSIEETGKLNLGPSTTAKSSTTTEKSKGISATGSDPVENKTNWDTIIPASDEAPPMGSTEQETEEEMINVVRRLRKQGLKPSEIEDLVMFEQRRDQTKIKSKGTHGRGRGRKASLNNAE